METQQLFSLNKVAAEFIRIGQSHSALHTLTAIEAQLQELPPLASTYTLYIVVYNNYAALHKSTQEYALALRYLKEAAQFEVLAGMKDATRAATYLNICSVYSLMNKPALALEQGRMAVKLLHKHKHSHSKVLRDAYKQCVAECTKLGKTEEAAEYLEKIETLMSRSRSEGYRTPISICSRPRTQYKKSRKFHMRPEPLNFSVHKRRSKASEDFKVRFLTGERMQPMFGLRKCIFNRGLAVNKGRHKRIRRFRTVKERENAVQLCWKSKQRGPRKAAILIRKITHTNYSSSKTSNIIFLQAVLRGSRERRIIEELARAATTIQKNIRSYQCRNIYQGIRRAVVHIQRYFRATTPILRLE